MRPFRDCRTEISEEAMVCLKCGAPFPARDKRDGWGFEYKSKAALLGLPLLHISFKYRSNRMPVIAKGIVAIGQFGCGVLPISQFGVGLFSVFQFTVWGGYALAQVALAYSLIAQFGLFVRCGRGQMVMSLNELIGSFEAERLANCMMLRYWIAFHS